MRNPVDFPTWIGVALVTVVPFVNPIGTAVLLPGIRIAGGTDIGSLRKSLGVAGVGSLPKIMGFLLICIGAQFAINGVRDLAMDAEFWRP